MKLNKLFKNDTRERLTEWVVQELDLPADDAEVLKVVQNIVNNALDEFETRFVDYLLYGEASNI